MIGIILIGHNCIASEMLAATEHVVGEQPLMQALDVSSDSDPEAVRKSLLSKIKACDVGQGVLLLADMFGGTPCNIAMACFEAGSIEVISGFNLPLLIKAATLRSSENNLTVLADKVLQSGRQYMCLASHVVGQMKSAPCLPAKEDQAGRDKVGGDQASG